MAVGTASEVPSQSCVKPKLDRIDPVKAHVVDPNGIRF